MGCRQLRGRGPVDYERSAFVFWPERAWRSVLYSGFGSANISGSIPEGGNDGTRHGSAATGKDWAARGERGVSRSGGRAAGLRPAAGSETRRQTCQSSSPNRRPRKGYNPLAPERVAEILKRLDQLYPDVTCALTSQERVGVGGGDHSFGAVDRRQCEPGDAGIVSEISDGRRILPRSRRSNLSPTFTRPDFFAINRNRWWGRRRRLSSEFGGEVPDDMDKLLTLPGVARKTANVVLGTWFRKADGRGGGHACDPHLAAAGAHQEYRRPKIEQDLMKVIPQEKWILFSHQIIWHGRKLCMARRPKCVECALENICHAGDKTWSTVEIHKNAKLYEHGDRCWHYRDLSTA